MRNQYTRMRGMLGEDAEKAGIESFEEASEQQPEGSGSGGSTPDGKYDGSAPVRSGKEWSSEPSYAPYTDDPEAGPDPGIMLQEQRRLMDGACSRSWTMIVVLGAELERACRSGQSSGGAVTFDWTAEGSVVADQWRARMS